MNLQRPIMEIKQTPDEHKRDLKWPQYDNYIPQTDHLIDPQRNSYGYQRNCLQFLLKFFEIHINFAFASQFSNGDEAPTTTGGLARLFIDHMWNWWSSMPLWWLERFTLKFKKVFASNPFPRVKSFGSLLQNGKIAPKSNLG